MSEIKEVFENIQAMRDAYENFFDDGLTSQDVEELRRGSDDDGLIFCNRNYVFNNLADQDYSFVKRIKRSLKNA